MDGMGNTVSFEAYQAVHVHVPSKYMLFLRVEDLIVGCNQEVVVCCLVGLSNVSLFGQDANCCSVFVQRLCWSAFGTRFGGAVAACCDVLEVFLGAGF